MTDTNLIIPTNQTLSGGTYDVLQGNSMEVGGGGGFAPASFTDDGIAQIGDWVHAGNFSVGSGAQISFIGSDAGVSVTLDNGSQAYLSQPAGFHGTISANSGQELVDMDNSAGATSYKMAAGSDGKLDMLLLLKPNTSRFGPRTITAATIQLDPNTPAPTVLQSDDGLGDRTVYLSWGGAMPSNPGGPPILPMTHSV